MGWGNERQARLLFYLQLAGDNLFTLWEVAEAAGGGRVISQVCVLTPAESGQQEGEKTAEQCNRVGDRLWEGCVALS